MKNTKLETAKTPESSSTQTTLAGNPYKNGTIIRCAIKGTHVCPDDTCDGYNRHCTIWLRHSCK